MTRAGAALACWLLAAGAVFAQASLPKPAGRVNDFAELLGAPARAALEQRLQDVETKTSSEIAVATVKSLDGMSVEEYANRLFKEWGVGQEKTDNGWSCRVNRAWSLRRSIGPGSSVITSRQDWTMCRWRFGVVAR